MPAKKESRIDVDYFLEDSKIKNQESRVKTTSSSLRAPKGRGNLPRKIDASRATLSVPVYSLLGKDSGILSLPKEIFGQKVNNKLLSQAVRVYLTNQKSLPGSTKTRGEVEGSTAKIFRQKGTGRARHGGIRAPIFVGGGIAFGPKPRVTRLSLPQSMKKSALISALSGKAAEKSVIGLSGLEKASGKTKEMVKLVYKVSSIQYQGEEKKPKKSLSSLIVTAEKSDNVVRAVRNIPGIDVLPMSLINAYEVIRHDLLMITKEAVEKLVMKESKSHEESQKSEVKIKTVKEKKESK